MKDIVWHGNSREIVRNFPGAIRKDIGAELMLLQLGETPVHSRLCHPSVEAFGRSESETVVTTIESFIL